MKTPLSRQAVKLLSCGRGNLRATRKYVDPRREQELHSYLFKTVGIRRKKEEVLSELLGEKQQTFWDSKSHVQSCFDIALIRLPPKRRQTIMLQEKSSSMSMSKLKQMEAMGRFVLCALGPQRFPAVEESALYVETYYCSDSRLLVFPDNTFYILLSGLIIERCGNI